MEKKHSPKLAQDLAPLEVRIKEVTEARSALEQKLRELEAELGGYAEDRQRYDALQQVCTALTRLDEQNARELFWCELP